MRERKFGSSLGAMFAAVAAAGVAIKDGVEGIARAAEDAVESMSVYSQITREKHGKHRGKGRNKRPRNHIKNNRGDFAGYTARQFISQRYYAGKSVPAQAREALDAAVARRERRGAKRAFAERRTQEGVLLNQECEAYYRRLRNFEDNHGRPGGATQFDRADAMARCGWVRLEALMNAWDNKTPLADVA